MSCASPRISCELDRIADALEGVNVADLLGTLIATVVGAGLALAGAWWLDRRRSTSEEAQRYESRLDAAFERVALEVGERRHALATTLGSPVPAARLHAAANLARMVARGDDVAVTKAMQYAIDRIGELSTSAEQEVPTRLVGQILRAWREGSQDAATTEQRLSGLAPRPAR